MEIKSRECEFFIVHMQNNTAYETPVMATGNDANDSKNNSYWNKAGDFVKQARLIRVVIATLVLLYTQ